MSLRCEKKVKLSCQGVAGCFVQAAIGCLLAGLFDALRAHCLEGKPYLGMCLGLQVPAASSGRWVAPEAITIRQVLFDSSEEADGVAGLGVIPGKVLRFQSETLSVPQVRCCTAPRTKRLST